MKNNNSLADFETPILMLVFKREETTQRVFDQVKVIKPKNLYVVADGWRNEGEEIACKKVRAIFNQIDWDCNFQTNFADVNMGCKDRVSSGISWFFDNVEEGIILEDDILPHESFFRFSAEMLKKYRNDYQIMHINGSNFSTKNRSSNTYRYTHLFNIWGWATWKRAWKLYDLEMRGLNWLEKGGEFSRLHPENFHHYLPFLHDVKNGVVNTWDAQWAITCHLNIGIGIQPEVNLITNIGYGKDGTHTSLEDEKRILPHGEFCFPINAPTIRAVDVKEDDYVVGLSHK